VKSPNVSGQAYAFLALTPVKPGEEGPLKTYLEGLRKPGPSPFSRVPGTHMARFVIVERFFNAPSYKQRLRSPHMYFESNFNGGWEEYIDAFSHILARGMTAFWGSSFGFPKPLPTAPFKSYITENETSASHYYSAYPQATATMVKAALALDDKLEPLIKRAGEMSPKQFEAEYKKLLTETQSYL
jgi:hypothetical protein